MSRFLAIVVATGCIAPAGPAYPAALELQFTYADFMKVPPAQQKREFAALSPEDRAAVMKQHLERWLEVHRPDLSSRAQALVQETIDLVGPELYSRPPSETEQQRVTVLGQRMACALGDARAGTLMQFDRPPQRINQTWGESTREWVDWLVNCAGR